MKLMNLDQLGFIIGVDTDATLTDDGPQVRMSVNSIDQKHDDDESRKVGIPRSTNVSDP